MMKEYQLFLILSCMKNFKLGLFAYVMKNVGMKSDKNSISSTPTADAEA